MASKEDFIIFICREINHHQREIERLQEELKRVRLGKKYKEELQNETEGEDEK